MRLPAASSKGFDVVAIGENSLDYLGVLESGSTDAHADKVALAQFEAMPGGQAATFAVGCARQGCRSRYVGAFGHDSTAAIARQALADEGVDVVAIEVPRARSRVAVVLVEPGGDRRVFEYRDPMLRLAPDDVPVDAMLDARLMMLDATHLAASIAAARAARAAGIPTLVDIDRPVAGCEDLLSQIDILIVPDHFAALYSREPDPRSAVWAIAETFHPDVAVVTCHDKGSVAVCNGSLVGTPAYRTDIVDTTGAGDAFRVGFASALVRLGPDVPLATVLDHANAAAALNCRAAGAQRGLPSWAEVERLVTTRGRVRSK